MSSNFLFCELRELSYFPTIGCGSSIGVMADINVIARSRVMVRFSIVRFFSK